MAKKCIEDNRYDQTTPIDRNRQIYLLHCYQGEKVSTLAKTFNVSRTTIMNAIKKHQKIQEEESRDLLKKYPPRLEDYEFETTFYGKTPFRKD